jgi:chorismate-pyruvate lyase
LTAKKSSPDLGTLISLFFADPSQLGQFRAVSVEEVPAPFNQLLAHNHHMTVTVESFHSCPVNVEVLETVTSDADAGTSDADAGTSDADAGTSDADAGTSDADAGTSDADAGEHYSRKILLRRATDNAVVQYGIVRLDLRFLPPEVVDEIRSEETPLGRVLIKHDVMREVQLTELWECQVGPELKRYLGDECPTVYGRTALIYCNGEPVIELLEIVTPR